MVRKRGDAALVELARKYDRAKLHAQALLVTPQEFACRRRGVTPEVEAAVLASPRT